MDTIYLPEVDTVVVSVIDTIFLVIQDTSAIQATQVLWKSSWFWSLVVGVAAFISALASLYSVSISKRLFAHSKQLTEKTQKQVINSEWSTLITKKSKLWKGVKTGYTIWLQEIKWGDLKNEERPPKALVNLLDNAGVPEGIDNIEDIDSFWRDVGNSNNPEIVWLHKFFCRVHPPMGRYTSSVIFESRHERTKDWNEFYEARATVTSSLNGWGESISMDYLVDRFQNQRIEIILFAWLELSLFNSNDKEWFNKPHFFKLASTIDKINK